MDTYESKIEANKVAWGKLAEDHYRCVLEWLEAQSIQMDLLTIQN